VASVLFGFLVVVDAYKQQIFSILRNLCGVLASLNLVDGSIGILAKL